LLTARCARCGATFEMRTAVADLRWAEQKSELLWL
jgi:hypothetical protein